MPRTLSGSRPLISRNNNILFNGNFEIFPSTITAQTNTGGNWIDGTSGGSSAKSAYGWGITTITSSAAAGFDTTTFHSGSCAMRLSTLNTSGTLIVASIKSNPPAASTAYAVFPLKASTSYTISGWIKTNNGATNGAFIDVREISASYSTTQTTSTNKLSGTNDWTKVNATFTTNSSTVFGFIFLRINANVSGTVSDVWYDDIILAPANLSRSVASSRTQVT